MLTAVLMACLPINGRGQSTPALTSSGLAPADSDFCGRHGSPSGAAGTCSEAALAKQNVMVPDWFKTAADGVDDAPSIQRAITALCQAGGGEINFGSRHYAINSAITQSCAVQWKGRGFQEQPTGSLSATGTWLDIGHAFINASVPPITISGYSASGSQVSDIAVAEPGMAPAPVAVYGTGGTHIIGWSPDTWTPTTYPEVFYLNASPGAIFRHVMFYGVYGGIVSVSSGRLHLENLRGQVFGYLLNDQTALDVDQVIDVHEFPYWSQADPVVRWQQLNTIVLEINRSDTPFFDRIFAIGVKSVLSLAYQENGLLSGLPTGIASGTISCDFTQYCIWVQRNPAGTQVTGQFSMIRHLVRYGPGPGPSR